MQIQCSKPQESTSQSESTTELFDPVRISIIASNVIFKADSQSCILNIFPKQRSKKINIRGHQVFDHHLLLDTKVSLRETCLISDYQHKIERICFLFSTFFFFGKTSYHTGFVNTTFPLIFQEVYYREIKTLLFHKFDQYLFQYSIPAIPF